VIGSAKTQRLARPDPGVRWGFIGAGRVARIALAPAVHADPASTLEVVGARSAERAAALRPKRAVTCYDAVIADPRVDAVYINLTNEAHLPWCLRALAAGKHVLCEKPLGLSAHEVDQMALAARKNHRIVVEAMAYRWHPWSRTVGALAEDVGRILEVEATFVAPRRQDGSYRWQRERGGGVRYDLGGYVLSAILASLSWRQPDVVSVETLLADPGVDASLTATMRYTCGTEAIAHASFSAPTGEELLRVTGERGALKIEGWPFSASRRDAVRLCASGGGRDRILEYPVIDLHRLMVRNFREVIRDGSGWVIPLSESRAVAQLSDIVGAAPSETRV
jgi:D-xylose 1-dehydrogenase (NADP+, D-xylono-1,5-lactone-forming)